MYYISMGLSQNRGTQTNVIFTPKWAPPKKTPICIYLYVLHKLSRNHIGIGRACQWPLFSHRLLSFEGRMPHAMAGVVAAFSAEFRGDAAFKVQQSNEVEQRKTCMGSYRAWQAFFFFRGNHA